MSRTVTLVLVDSAGTVSGALPPYQVPAPWWQDARDVVAGARERFGLDVTVLRLLSAERAEPHGGAVRYLAELAGPAPDPALLGPAPDDLSPHPARAPWAVPGGPSRSVDWAVRMLDGMAGGPVRARQERTWNLSAIWWFDRRDGTGAGPVGWLKQVPPFFAHEAAVLRWLGDQFPGLAPRVHAADGDGRLLLAHVPGEDWHDAGPAGRDGLAADLHRVQLRAVECVARLAAAGVPDRRGHRLARTIRDALAGYGADRGPVADLLAGLDRRLAAVAECGLPETLVHGDLHPGNARVDGVRRVILDWGDSYLGHPAFDILRLAEGLPDPEAAGLLRAWSARWRASVPGSDPDRAVALLRPVAALANAAVYARFLAAIESSERPYHAADVPTWLSRAAGLATDD